ncbi:MAG: hypothetical protein KAQ64_01580 [Candidatus Pacebacteria bacterium]|nr:hypothetical protein [Candidatus Paceibacterota bacterium]
MAGNLILNQVEEVLKDAKEEDSISIDYSKIRRFSEALKKASGSKFQVEKYKVKDLMLQARGECSIPSNDFETIEKILTN